MGHAPTVQGEVVRIATRVLNEIEDNSTTSYGCCDEDAPQITRHANSSVWLSSGCLATSTPCRSLRRRSDVEHHSGATA